jgi:phosphoribosylglycinamide formyltransferase 1
MSKPKILVFASGTKKGGGSGFANLVRASCDGRLDADIVGVVSNHADGGVRTHATALNIPFTHFPPPWNKTEYQRITKESGAEFFACSGWLKLIVGLNPNTAFNARTVFNIHPGPASIPYKGVGMYGVHVHRKIMQDYGTKKITHSAVSMLFVTEGEHDAGPVFFNLPVPIHPDDTFETLEDRIHMVEHLYQPLITNLVVHRHITWDGVNLRSLEYSPLARSTLENIYQR